MLSERLSNKRNVKVAAGIGLFALSALGLSSCDIHPSISGEVTKKYEAFFTSGSFPPSTDFVVHDIIYKTCKENSNDNCELHTASISKKLYDHLWVGDQVQVDFGLSGDITDITNVTH